MDEPRYSLVGTPLEILLGRTTVMEAGAREWVQKRGTIHNDLGESGR